MKFGSVLKYWAIAGCSCVYLGVGAVASASHFTLNLASLLEKLKNPAIADAELSEVLTLIIKELPSTQALLALKPLLSERSPDVRANAALGIGNIQGRDSLLALRPVFKDPSGLVRHLGAYVLLTKRSHSWDSDANDLFVNAVIEEQLHHEFVMTLAGYKPFSVTNCSAVCRAIFEKLRTEGRVLNDDLGWFVNRGTLVSYSRKAIRELMNNPRIMRQLDASGFPPIHNIDEAIETFRNFWLGTLMNSEGSILEFSQQHFDIVSGIFFGFPLDEVLAYAGITAARRSGYNQNLFPDHGRETFFGWVVVSTTSNSEVDKMLTRGRMSVDQYHQLAARGLTALEILNGWHTRPEKLCGPALTTAIPSANR